MVLNIISVVEIKNNSTQPITVSVTPYFNSPVFNPNGGDIPIPPGGEIEVEGARVGTGQLEQLAKNPNLAIKHGTKKI